MYWMVALKVWSVSCKNQGKKGKEGKKKVVGAKLEGSNPYVLSRDGGVIKTIWTLPQKISFGHRMTLSHANRIAEITYTLARAKHKVTIFKNNIL